MAGASKRIGDMLTEHDAKWSREHETAARERRQTNERIEQLTRQHTELRRDLQKTELHVPARHTRRRPLGG